MSKKYVADILNLELIDQLFPSNRKLVPNVEDVYELEIAFFENQILSDEELIRNGSYFSKVGDTLTRHFKMCTGKPLNIPNYSPRLKTFFQKNLFRTGYAIHGLFPYRGKFHPQMIKGLMNVMGLKPGHTVLDPMMGSGTVLVEAALMGINSIGIDASPFCTYMAQTKLNALTLPLTRSYNALNKYQEVFSYFQKKNENLISGDKAQNETKAKVFKVMEPTEQYGTSNENERLETYKFLLLDFLDSVGYSERSNKNSLVEQFKAVLERYLFVVEKIQAVLQGFESDLATSKIIEGDARSLDLEDETLDGILFSPPYSFAIDYLKNDAFHLNYLQIQTEQLKDKMVGLRGRGLANKYNLYKQDMAKILAECQRVLRPRCFCTVIIGTNNNQLAKALNISPDEVQGLHNVLVDIGIQCGLRTIKKVRIPISGLSNTMRCEYILLMQK